MAARKNTTSKKVTALYGAAPNQYLCVRDITVAGGETFETTADEVEALLAQGIPVTVTETAESEADDGAGQGESSDNPDSKE